MVVSEMDYPEVSKKWYKGLLRSKHDPDDKDAQTPYIFSYEDPKVYTDYKVVYQTASELQAEREKLRTDSVFEYRDSVISEENYATQYETIFTYADPLTADPLLTGWNERTEQGRKQSVGPSASVVLLGLSALFLILLFPVLCWIYVKHVATNERLVVIRLGRRLRTKGPGFVVTLPFCDRSHRLLLTEQVLDVGPVTGETKDKGEVEVRCEITYRVMDPDCTYVSTTKSPHKLLTSLAETCMSKSLGQLTWLQLEDSGGKQDFANEIVTSLNCHCGVHGLQVARVVCTTMALTRAPPSPESVKHFALSAVQKQLQGITSLFFPGGRSATAKKTAADPTVAGSSTVTTQPATTVTVEPGAVDPKTRSQSVDLPHPKDTVSSAVENEAINRTRLLSLRLSNGSATRSIVCAQVISRAQPFLSNDLVCKALNRTTLQLVVGSERIQEPVPSPSDAASDEAQFSVVYLDANSGRAAMGVLNSPEVVMYVTAEDLSEVLAGHLDLMKAVNDGRIVVKGNSKALDKLRHLLFLRSG